MILNTAHAEFTAVGMFESCIKTGSYGLRECVRSVASILDIGANVGFFSVTARILFPDAKVVSLEPDPTTFQQLISNCKHLRIQPVNLALGPGVPLRMFLNHQRDKISLGNRYDIGGIGTIETPSTRMSSIVDSFSLNDGLFIKIDCEGAERYLVGDPEAENIIKNCVGIGGEFHTVSELTAVQFEQWLRSLIGDTHDVKFFQLFRRSIIEFRAIRKILNPINPPTVRPSRKVIFKQEVRIIRHKQMVRRNRRLHFVVGQIEEFDHDFASHMVCCGYASYVL